MKIVFFGTPDFSVKTLRNLYRDNDIEIISVITQPDKKAGRKGELKEPPIKTAAKKLKLKIFQPENNIDLKKFLKGIKCDFFVVIAFGMILDKEILNIPKYGAINIHASLLPKYRGASPIQESLLHGDKYTGISVMKMDAKLDHGPVYILKKTEILKDDDLNTLSERLSKISAEITPLILKDISSGYLTPIKQNHETATFCKKIKKTDGKINWEKTSEDISNMIKAFSVWPSTFTEIDGKKLKIIEADYENNSNIKNQPGKFFIENNVLKIATKKGNIIPLKVQIEGKNEMDIKSFLNGYKSLLEKTP